MARLTKYFDPSGRYISKAESTKIPAKDFILSEFDNGIVKIILRQSALFMTTSDVPQQDYIRFHVDAYNIVEGKYIFDPDVTKGFREQTEADDHYRHFLEKFSESYYDVNDGRFIEVGNVLKPPSKDIPMFVEGGASALSFGMW